MKEEGNFPAIAIGLNNIENKKSQSSEYIVASYGVNNVDYTIGLGWGGLDGLNSYENFLDSWTMNFLRKGFVFNE